MMPFLGIGDGADEALGKKKAAATRRDAAMKRVTGIRAFM
jgi:hypothetical protein